MGYILLLLGCHPKPEKGNEEKGGKEGGAVNCSVQFNVGGIKALGFQSH